MEWLSLPEIEFPSLTEGISMCMMWEEAKKGFPSAKGNLRPAANVFESHLESFKSFGSFKVIESPLLSIYKLF